MSLIWPKGTWAQSRHGVSAGMRMFDFDSIQFQVTLTRTNLAESECVGPVHAPFFPAVKFEAGS